MSDQNQSIDDKTARSMKWLVLGLVWITVISYFLSFLIQKLVEYFPGISTLFSYPEKINIPYPFNLLGLIICFLGLILVAWANFTLLVVGKIGLKAREPYHIPSNLVFKGPYKYSRNPIYLAVVIMLFGLVIVTTSLLIAILTIGVFFLFRIKFIGWEEKNLEEAFGSEYLDYKKRVRRWI
ncbi:MAG: methyltransferase family protein [Candidatus Kariarchaeaceae archaeon]|jgi:protein-S-isoprenylcysteine O-methyltransferase Ste14